MGDEENGGLVGGRCHHLPFLTGDPGVLGVKSRQCYEKSLDSLHAFAKVVL
jgi:hypothetical protein